MEGLGQVEDVLAPQEGGGQTGFRLFATACCGLAPNRSKPRSCRASQTGFDKACCHVGQAGAAAATTGGWGGHQAGGPAAAAAPSRACTAVAAGTAGDTVPACVG